MRQKDLHHLVKCCQVHKHSRTCYKYWKGPPNPKECRFDLDENNICPETTFDMESGEICFRCLDGLVNNFNETILEAIRCNMDIKFIGSGPAAKAVTYYITNYITKSQLKTHIAYAALELAVKKLGVFCPDDDEVTMRAKKMLQKCAFSMISHQELSAQQVASYLMDYEDHFTSHLYRNLYWTSFEALINREQHSPECYETLKSNDVETSTAEEPEDSLNDSDQRIDESEIESIIDDESDADELDRNEASNNENVDEEVTIAVQASGDLIAKATQVADYQLRDKKLEGLSVWDFVSMFDKVPKSRLRQTRKENIRSSDDSESDSDDGFDNEFSDVINNGLRVEVVNDLYPDSPDTISQNHASTSRKSRKEWFYFASEHIESKTHRLSIRTHEKKFVLVPIGPSIPRRDQRKTYARYCRLMLIFFKPWRHASDLRATGQKWEDAFKSYMEICPHDVKKMLDNMQILHECRDSGNDHFAERRNRRHGYRQYNIPSEMINTCTDNSDDFGGVEPSVILEHLESISSSNSERVARSQDIVNDSLLHAEMSGMFDEPLNRETQFHSNPGHEIHTYDLTLEDQWKTEYEKRRDQWKKKIVVSPNPTTRPESSTNHEQEYFDDGSAFRNALDGQSINPTIAQDVPQTVTENTINIEAMISEFTLNVEQARAFRIICEQSLQKDVEPLKMYIGGAGGTGKSRVINALREFFIRRGQERRFRLASYTGVAAKNISGMTVHSALSLNQHKKGDTNGKTRRDLTAMWEGVDFFFIDEISMIGCKMLYQISEALIEAKGNTSPFGGINLIVAGDFAQLPPVGESRLTASIDTSQSRQTSKRGQENVFGKLLWLSMNKVVILKQNMRQSGPENAPLVDLLTRLREGRCTNKDYELLSSRVLQNMNVDWGKWKNTPIIVSENAQKDALNIRAAEAFARKTNQPLHWYHAIDTHQRNIVTDPTLNAYLEKLNSGVTNQRLGKIPLVIGMPVMITQNYDVENGIVNGCTGILKTIRYQKNAQGIRYATSCVVESSTITGAPLSTLEPHQAVVLQDTITMTFRHPYSGKKCTIRRTQLPILPAFAMTAHKAQGQTMEKVLVDLESCKGTESPYVMVSRVTSLEGLLILRPFKSSKIQCRLSEDTRKEFKRLEKLRLHTIVETGTMEEKAGAQILLSPPQACQAAANIQVENDLRVAPDHIRQHSRKRLLPKNPSTNKINEMNLKPPNSDPEQLNTLAPEEEMMCVDRNLCTSTTLHSSESQARPSRPITKRRLKEVEPSTQHDNHRRKSRRLI